MKKLVSAILKLVIGANVIATVWIFTLTVYVVIDVTGRILFHAPIPGTPELAKLSIVAITFLQIPYVLLKKRHIRTTIIIDHVSPKCRGIIEIFSGLLGLLVFAMIFYGGWDLMIQAFVTNAYEGEGALRVPTQPNRTIVEFGSALMVFLFVLYIIDNIKLVFKGDKEQ